MSRAEKKGKRSGKSKWVRIVILLLLLILVTSFCLFVLPYIFAKNEMPANSVMTITARADSSLLLTWDETASADRYLVQALYASDGKGQEDVIFFSEYHTDNSCVLPDLPPDREVTLRLNTEVSYWHPWKEKVRAGETPMERTFIPNIPAVKTLNIEMDAEEKTAALSWAYTAGDSCRLYKVSGDDKLTLMRTVDAGNTVITFGEGCDMEMPGYEDTCRFVLVPLRQVPGIVISGTPSEQIGISREDLLGSVLVLDCTDEGNNAYTLTWNETKGINFELQLLNETTGVWDTLAKYSRADERSYSTGHLSPFEAYDLRVVALGGQTLTDNEFAALAAQFHLTTGALALYATIWPLKELEVYKDADRAVVIGSVPVTAAFCVLGEEDGLFYIRFSDNEYGYIDSNYCLINLPDYMGKLCSYDITNSYSSRYMVHEYEISCVTDTVVEGYENIQLHNGNFLVPLLYPTAQRLVTAAQAALVEGYRLKIYDAYRPNQATRAIYDLTLAIIDNPIPEETFTGEPVDDLPEVGEEEVLTYKSLLSNAAYSLNDFLASSGSLHNMGIALDLTLESLSTGEELEMQTSMHDLSWYSEIYANNANANLLTSYLKGAGFGGLTSEWWHFQDNKLRDALDLSTFRWSGVSPQCWIKNDDGWKYRRSDGSFYKSCKAAISGVDYIFDKQGYAQLK